MSKFVVMVMVMRMAMFVSMQRVRESIGVTELRETVYNRLCSTIASTIDLLSLLNAVEINCDQQ